MTVVRSGCSYHVGTHMQIFGVTAINVPDLLQALRKQGDVVTIGTETGVLESKRLIIDIAETML